MHAEPDEAGKEPAAVSWLLEEVDENEGKQNLDGHDQVHVAPEAGNLPGGIYEEE